MTVHFINDKFERGSFLLAFKLLIGKQTYEVLGNAIHKVMTEYNLNTNNVTDIITDGGTALCKMFKMYGDRVDATEMNIEDEENDISTDVTQNRMAIQDFLVDENGYEFQSEIVDFTAFSGDETSNANNFYDTDYYFVENVETQQQCSIVLPPQKRCMSHVLNLLSKDFQESLSGLAKAAFFNTMESMHTFWAITRTSSKAKSICQEVLSEIL